MTNDKRELVSQITVPALFLHGDRDPMVPIEGSVEAAAATPNASLVVLDGCGHWLQLERPERFEAEIRGFLGRLAE
mgnify:CR=1 FL=1